MGNGVLILVLEIFSAVRVLVSKADVIIVDSLRLHHDGVIVNDVSRLSAGVWYLWCEAGGVLTSTLPEQRSEGRGETAEATEKSLFVTQS